MLTVSLESNQGSPTEDELELWKQEMERDNFRFSDEEKRLGPESWIKSDRVVKGSGKRVHWTE